MYMMRSCLLSLVIVMGFATTQAQVIPVENLRALISSSVIVDGQFDVTPTRDSKDHLLTSIEQARELTVVVPGQGVLSIQPHHEGSALSFTLKSSDNVKQIISGTAAQELNRDLQSLLRKTQIESARIHASELMEASQTPEVAALLDQALITEIHFEIDSADKTRPLSPLAGATVLTKEGQVLHISFDVYGDVEVSIYTKTDKGIKTVLELTDWDKSNQARNFLRFLRNKANAVKNLYLSPETQGRLIEIARPTTKAAKKKAQQSSPIYFISLELIPKKQVEYYSIAKTSTWNLFPDHKISAKHPHSYSCNMIYR